MLDISSGKLRARQHECGLCCAQCVHRRAYREYSVVVSSFPSVSDRKERLLLAVVN